MRYITFDEAFKLLKNCSAVIWTDFGSLTYPVVYDEEMEDPNEDQFLLLESMDEEGYEYRSMFYRGKNQRPKVEGSKLFLVDNTGEEVEMTLLVPQNLE